MLNDLRFALRMLLKNPGFTAVAALTLALGIGACTSIFSIVDAVLLRSLPYGEPDRIIQLREINEKSLQMAVTEPNYLDVRTRSHSLEAVAQYGGGLITVTGGNQPVRANALDVSSGFFRVLEIRPFLGRLFLPEESKVGGEAVAVVSYGFWKQVLGGKADLSGIRLRMIERRFTVVGVMPAGFNFPQDTEIWVPRELFSPDTSRTAHNWSVIARLHAGVSLEQARAEVSAIGRQLRQENGEDTNAVDFALIPLHKYLVGNVRDALMIIFAAVGFLLLVAGANVTNLLLARVTARQKEFAVRAALGASRRRLVRQFITENLLLTLVAGALGVLLSFWGVDLLIGLNQKALPRASEIGVDARALMFTLGLSLLIAVVLGLVPMFRLSKQDLQSGLKASGPGQPAGTTNHQLRGLLVVVQIALTLILLIGAGLLGKSFYRLLHVDPGFRTESAVVMDLSLPRSEDDVRKKLLAKSTRLFYQELIERLNRLPGVTAVGGVNGLPMTGIARNETFLIDDDPSKTGYAEYRLASQGYFAAMGIPLVRGRLFEASEGPDSLHVAVISQSLARRVWPNENPIGKRIQFGNMDGDLRLLHIVGIVGDVRERGLDAELRPTVYAYALQRPQASDLSVVVRGQSDPATLVPAMRRVVQSLDPELPINFRTLEQIFSSSLDQRRFSLVIFGAFAAVALLLAVMGVYGVMTYAVAQRSKEIGVRMALGATVRDILKQTMGQGLRLIVPGLAVGLIGALAVTRLLVTLLFGVSPADSFTFATVAGLLATVALLACYIPARRAAKVDPVVALRYE